MNKIKILSSLIFLCFLSCSKKVVSSGINNEPMIIDNNNCKYYFDTLLKENVYTEVDNPPVYENGKAKFLLDFIETYRHPDEEEYPSKSILKIIVSKEGDILSVDVLTKTETSDTVLDEIKNTILALPNWTTGKCNDINVTCEVRFPIIF